jgi:hypothetical protein
MSAPKLIAIIAAILFVVLMVIANLGDGSGEPISSEQPTPSSLDYDKPPEERIPTH